jgi:hypothetical protein
MAGKEALIAIVEGNWQSQGETKVILEVSLKLYCSFREYK